MNQIETIPTDQLVQKVIENNAVIKQITEFNDAIFAEVIKRADQNRPVQQELF